MSQIPAHILAILAKQVRAIPPAPLVQPRDRTPVFAPQKGAPKSVRTIVDIVDECTFEVHDDMVLCDNNTEDFSLSVVE